MICENCGAENKDNAKFCKECGKLVINKEKTTDINSENITKTSSNVDFVANNQRDMDNITQSNKKQQEKKKSILPLVFILCSIIVIGAGIFVFLKYFNQYNFDDILYNSDKPIDSVNEAVSENLAILNFNENEDSENWHDNTTSLAGDKKIVVRANPETIIWDAVGNFKNGMARIKRFGLPIDTYGFIDRNGDLRVPCIYPNAEEFKEGMARVVDEWGKTGYIDTTGNVIIPFIYDSATDFSEGLALVKNNAVYGFIDKTGNMVIKLEYGNAYPFQEGLACVGMRTDDGYYYGCIDKTGNLVIPLMYDQYFYFNESGVARTYKDQYLLFIDRAGNIIVSFSPEAVGNLKIEYFSENIVKVQGYDHLWYNIWGLYDFSINEYILPLEYDMIYPMKEGMAVIKKDGKWGFVNERGIIAVPLMYDLTQDFSEGLAIVEKIGAFGAKYGYIDKNGNEVIPLIYTDAEPFSGGFAAVENKLWGYIDTNGDEAFPFVYSYARSFYDGLALVNTSLVSYEILEITNKK